MRTLLLLALGAVQVAILMSSGGAVAANSGATVAQGQSSHLLSYVERFDGVVTFQNTRGGVQSLHVTIRDWTIYAVKVNVTIPTQGFTVAYLVAGNISARGTSPLERGSSPFWSVRSGVPISVLVTSEAATIETISSIPIK
jgi:hypothetical protein